MKSTAKPMVLTLLVVLAAFLALAPNALAAPTAAGTDITNQATLTFTVDVAGTPVTQPTVTSGTTTFKVDQKVDLTVEYQGGTTVGAFPSSAGNILTFKVANTGNKVQDFALYVEQTSDTFGIDLGSDGTADESDTFDVASYVIRVESGATAGYQPLEDTLAYVDELTYNDGGASANVITVYVIATLPADDAGRPFSTSSNEIAGITLVAEAHDGGGAAALGTVTGTAGNTNTLTAVDVVLGDGIGQEDITTDSDDADSNSVDDANRDGRSSDVGAFQVQLATVLVVKSQSVIWDPVNLAVSPMPIPGAIIKYQIKITNTSGGTVNLTTITDDIANNFNLNLDYNLDTTANDVVEWVVTGGTRTTKTGVANIGSGVAYAGDPGGLLTINLATLLGVDGPSYTAGELKNTEVVDVYFTAEIL